MANCNNGWKLKNVLGKIKTNPGFSKIPASRLAKSKPGSRVALPCPQFAQKAAMMERRKWTKQDKPLLRPFCTYRCYFSSPICPACANKSIIGCHSSDEPTLSISVSFYFLLVPKLGMISGVLVYSPITTKRHF